MKMEDVIQTGGNVVIGAAAVLLAPLVISGLARFTRPLAKTTLKGGLIAWERIKELSAETKEDFEDLSAEVQAEISGAAAASGSKEKQAPKAAAKTSSGSEKGAAAKKTAATQKTAAKRSPSKKTQAKTASAESAPEKSAEKEEPETKKASLPKQKAESDKAAEKKATADEKQPEANAAKEASSDATAGNAPEDSQENQMTGDSTPPADSSKKEGN